MVRSTSSDGAGTQELVVKLPGRPAGEAIRFSIAARFAKPS